MHTSTTASFHSQDQCERGSCVAHLVFTLYSLDKGMHALSEIDACCMHAAGTSLRLSLHRSLDVILDAISFLFLLELVHYLLIVSCHI
jgi:hypothetical protein